MQPQSRRTFLRNVAIGVAACAAGQAFTLASHPPPVRAQPERPSAWQTEWESLIAAATTEGRLSLITWGDTWGGPGFAGFSGVAARFEEAFPGIVVDRLSESSATVWLDKVRQSRRAGSDRYDLALVQSGPALQSGKPDGIWAPLKPLLFHPEVLDDTAWRGGSLAARYLDDGAELCLSWEYQVLHAYAVNADLVHDGEIRSVVDLLDPQWTGKIISLDPRLGLGLNSAAAVARSHGTGLLQRLLVDQRPTFTGTAGRLAESLVRGHYPIALGVRPKALAPFRESGLADKVRWLDLPDADFAVTTSLLHVDRAPHPAAARLFANWILTREGQTILAGSLPTTSARLDVPPFEPDGVGTASADYFEPDREANAQHTASTRAFIASLPGGITVSG
jgi:iron(III) transport system substrate-binding protein